jgi:uncharacterized protein YgbK (DUF1537 family)
LLLAYYGDDFTGSTDVLEALSTGGVEAVLFVEPPSDDMLRRYAHVRAVGIAGNSRTMSPDSMNRTLPDAFRTMLNLRPRIAHYKVCSTFDSSPEIGSIGRAIDIGREVFQNEIVPLLVAVPTLRRYCVFGNLFAKSGLNSDTFRLDRHPTMARHPVTPMKEADLRVHLSKQTSAPVELIDVLTLDHGLNAVRYAIAQIRHSGAILLFDTLSDDHLATAGRVIWETQQREQKPLFVAGSSGVDYALVKYWQNAGIVSMATCAAGRSPAIPPVDRTLVVSGSCSPVTSRQIGWALERGFAEAAIDPEELLHAAQREAHVAKLATNIISMLESGHSVIAHTSRGAVDSSIAGELATNTSAGANLGTQLGQVLREVLCATSLRRVAVVGGDTSGHVARALEIEAVEMIAPLEPGAPLCVVRSRDSAIDGIEITFKGGQVGHDDFFGTLLAGRSSHVSMGVTV